MSSKEPQTKKIDITTADIKDLDKLIAQLKKDQAKAVKKACGGYHKKARGGMFKGTF